MRFAIPGLGVGWGCCHRGGKDKDISPCISPRAHLGPCLRCAWFKKGQFKIGLGNIEILNFNYFLLLG